MRDNIFDFEQYAACARQVIAEGAVLLKNDNQTLPLQDGETIALFGRSQYNYYKSGTGSGGLVNAKYVVDIPQALIGCRKYVINEMVQNVYEEWIKENPVDFGDGWGKEPWYQKEMPLDRETVCKAATESETAVIIIGRTAGEDQDNISEPGSYLLTEQEEEMLEKVCNAFQKTIVLLNVGNIIDMKWVERYNPSAVLYVWQGGGEGGNGVLDVLDGTVTPCGKLSDTIAYDISDYPSTKNFGDPDNNIYEEDIYVGYRYFETFHPKRVLYPFGYGLSYTTFDIENVSIQSFDNITKDCILTAQMRVRNTGCTHGKEVVQIYVKKPVGMLGQPIKVLCGYRKTKDLQVGEFEDIEISFNWYTVSSYDDGITGYKSSYVLEQGDYVFYVGTDVRSAKPVDVISIPELIVIEKLQEVMAPVVNALCLHAEADVQITGYKKSLKPMSLRTVTPMERRKRRLVKDIAYTGDKGYKLSDVRLGRISMDTFIAQLSDEDLCSIMRGEGMGSSKVTPGTGGAFGGVTDRLLHFGIPIGCCCDGPSGIRMDCGTKAFSLPIGTCMACTFNDDLIREIYEWEGLELRKNKIDILLGPGMNIHRNPLNGRNFEYFSEDPLLSGKIAAAQLRGMHKYQVTGTIKHFACNNQEYRRNFVDGIISERAIREIYLKGFEIAVKEGGAYTVMTTYGPVNGIYTSSNYDLVTTVLREEWGFQGIVMTDWWAKGNEEGQSGTGKNTAVIARAQNDLYMVVNDATSNSGNDNSIVGLNNGIVTRGEFQRNAANICAVLLRLPVMDRFLGIESELDCQLKSCLSEEDEALSKAQDLDISNGFLELDPLMIHTGKGQINLFKVFTAPRGIYKLSITCRADTDNELSQIPLSVFQEKNLVTSINLTGRDKEEQTFECMLDMAFMGSFYLKMYFGQSGMEIRRCVFELEKNMEEEIAAIRAQMEMD